MRLSMGPALKMICAGRVPFFVARVLGRSASLLVVFSVRVGGIHTLLFDCFINHVSIVAPYDI